MEGKDFVLYEFLILRERGILRSFPCNRKPKYYSHKNSISLILFLFKEEDGSRQTMEK